MRGVGKIEGAKLARAPERRPADSAGQRWAVSTGVEKAAADDVQMVAERWSSPEASDTGSVRPPTDRTASAADMSAASSSWARHRAALCP